MALEDSPENILSRIAFFDVDSKPIEKDLTDKEKQLYLREIKKDITYFMKTYQKSNIHIDISGWVLWIAL